MSPRKRSAQVVGKRESQRPSTPPYEHDLASARSAEFIMSLLDVSSTVLHKCIHIKHNHSQPCFSYCAPNLGLSRLTPPNVTPMSTTRDVRSVPTAPPPYLLPHDLAAAALGAPLDDASRTRRSQSMGEGCLLDRLLVGRWMKKVYARRRHPDQRGVVPDVRGAASRTRADRHSAPFAATPAAPMRFALRVSARTTRRARVPAPRYAHLARLTSARGILVGSARPKIALMHAAVSLALGQQLELRRALLDDERGRSTATQHGPACRQGRHRASEKADIDRARHVVRPLRAGGARGACRSR